MLKTIFATFGIIPRKTYNLKLKYINWDVLRGIIDGDGCIASTNNGSTLRIDITSGCKEFLEQIRQFLTDNSISSSILESNRNKNPTYDLHVYRSKDILTIYERLYSNAHFFLRRKKDKFGPLLKKFGKCKLTNSGEENENSNLEPSSNREGAETRRE